MLGTVFIHTNPRQLVGAYVSRHSLRLNSARPEAFDVRIISTTSIPTPNPSTTASAGPSPGRRGCPSTSYPKSGRTWLRVMLSRYFQLRYGIPERFILGFDNFHAMDGRIPKIFFTHDNYLRDYTGEGALRPA